MSKLSKQYQPQEHEPAIYKEWEDSGAFSPDQKALAAGAKPFVLMLPLPNITGSLHMGHALQHTIMDIVVRYHRMLGEPTLWHPGTDHAGIGTQRVVEKALRERGIDRHDLGRAAFVKEVWKWRDIYGDKIISQMKRLGASCDWSRLVFTMDPQYVAAVHRAFIEYYKRGYIYRGSRLVNWCHNCRSVISDLEVEHEEQETDLVTLRYPIKNSEHYIDVATTRPETMLGDTAVAVHPDDQRYKKLVGATVILPLVARAIPVIADQRIDPEFGTGAVKITPAHDPLDAAIGQDNNLPTINIIGEDGKLTAAAGQFAGLSVAEARPKILNSLSQAGAVIKSEPYTHNIAVCSRCASHINPLVSRQWFVSMDKLKQETIEVAEQNIVQFLPPRWRQHFLTWMNDVHDWTISRQLWWGQQIPVWWKAGTRGTDQEENNFVVSLEKPTTGQWEQDPDVLDTWFSSALWPFATLGWPDATNDLKTFYPTSVLITARDILYLWVARMIFSGLELMKGESYGDNQLQQRIPFQQVFIHPTVLTNQGQRMSKSLGTGIDPLELIEQYGADATRFGLISQMSYDNQAIKFDEQAIKSARNFANKIWNLARLLHSLPTQESPTVADLWIELKYRHLARQVTQLLEAYKLGEAAHALYQFIWHDFADWYIEIIKTKGSTKTAQNVFKHTLKLLHPFMPHLTELLWQQEQSEPLMTSAWPSLKGEELSPEEEHSVTSALANFQDLVTTIRQVRTLLEIQPATIVDIYHEVSDVDDLADALQAISRTRLLAKPSATMRQFPLPGGGTVALSAKELTNAHFAKARQKLSTEEVQLTKFIEQQTKILANMRGQAPPNIQAAKKAAVTQARQRLIQVKNSHAALT